MRFLGRLFGRSPSPVERKSNGVIDSELIGDGVSIFTSMNKGIDEAGYVFVYAFEVDDRGNREGKVITLFGGSIEELRRKIKGSK